MTDTRSIRLLVAVGGHDFSWTPGQIVELSRAEAEKWADGERAVYHQEEPVEQPETDTKTGRRTRAGQQIETTETAPAVETTTARRPRKGTKSATGG